MGSEARGQVEQAAEGAAMLEATRVGVMED